MTETVKYIVVRESIRESIIRDATSFVTLTAMVGLGIVLESDAMQWIGGLLFLFVVFGKAAGKLKKMTAEEAIEFIQSGKET